MKNPYFSIIIPFYNKEKSLKQCLDSLSQQKFPKDEYELIAVNNNSTDGSIAIVNEYPNVKLVHEKQQGAYAARNTGTINAKGNFLVFTDADAQVNPNWLSTIHSILTQNNYAILLGWYFPAHSIKILQIHYLLVAERIKKSIREKNPSMLTACAANLIIKNEVFIKEGRFLNNSNSEDVYFVIRCLNKNYPIGFSDAITIKRNDINSIAIVLLKNFIYGCSNAVDIKDDITLLGKLRYMAIQVKYIIKYFPVGAGLILIALPYFIGYALSKLGILNSKNLAIIVNKYSQFISKKAI